MDPIGQLLQETKKNLQVTKLLNWPIRLQETNSKILSTDEGLRDCFLSMMWKRYMINYLTEAHMESFDED